MSIWNFSFSIRIWEVIKRARGGGTNITDYPKWEWRHFPHDVFNCIFLNENVWIDIKVPRKFVPEGPINNVPSLVQTMVRHRPGDKPLSEPMIVSLLTYICGTRPQWVRFHVNVYDSLATVWNVELRPNETRCPVHSWLRWRNCWFYMVL